MTIHGDLQESPSEVTLIECLTINRRAIGSGDREDQTVRALYMARGAHVDGPDQTYVGLRRPGPAVVITATGALGPVERAWAHGPARRPARATPVVTRSVGWPNTSARPARRSREAALDRLVST